MTFRQLVRALRLPFTSASALPYIHGAVAPGDDFQAGPFVLGLGTVVFTHLSANVANDYADALTGADSADPEYFGFFGGSKLIQEGVVTVRQTRVLAVCLACIAFAWMVAVSFSVGSWLVPGAYVLVLAAAWSYSCRPLSFCYRGVGEGVVFLLFGVATFGGGWFLQTGELPSIPGVRMAVLHGALVTAILTANEVADAAPDEQAGKRTLVVRVGARHGWVLFAGLGTLAYAQIALALLMGFTGTGWLLWALSGAVFFVPALVLLRRNWEDRRQLSEVAKLTIFAHSWTSIWLIAGRCL